jgi:amino acid transporter
MKANPGKNAGRTKSATPLAKPITEKPIADDTLSDSVREIHPDETVPTEQPTIEEKVKTLLVGKPFDLADSRVFQHVSLVAFLAWVGLGADGLSSSCYGPSEAFAHLQGHEYLAVFLALATVFTVVVISACYSHIIEAFPSGGGGYLVASKMLGSWVGALSGCALVVDYILTVTVSIAAAGDALFGLLSIGLGTDWKLLGITSTEWKIAFESAAIVVLIILNLRGVKESIKVLMPIFVTFLVTHAILISGVIGMHLFDLGGLSTRIVGDMQADVANPAYGWGFVIFAFLKAYSLGAGTYTGIEAVSNSMAVMREPRVATAQRTMIYMAISLAITAGGLMLAYLLLDIKAAHGGKTMNHLLTEEFVKFWPAWLANSFVWITILSESALLIVAAQAGFIGGPKCLANMAHDSWVPHWFGSLSERLASHYGILLMGGAALLALWATSGRVAELVIMYSINVFVTFTLSMIGMSLLWYQNRGKHPKWRSRLALFIFGAILCGSILCVTVGFKFFEGAWKTVALTGSLTAVSLLIRRYYGHVRKRLQGLDESLGTIEIKGEPNLAPPDPNEHTAVILVGGYSGLGVHTLLNSVRFVPNHFKNMIFISVGVVDSGNFKGAEEVEHLRGFTEASLEKYVELARRLGFPSRAYMAIGTDVVDELEQLCRTVHRDFPKSVVFAGQLVFQRETWYGALLHNQTAYSLQRRLQWDGVPMVILPTRVREA